MDLAPEGLSVQVLNAPVQWQSIDLLSDVHLHVDMPRTFDVWRTHLLNTPADAVFILGDLFEVWVGDDSIGEVFERTCCDVLRAAAKRRTVGFMPGNRDFLVGDAMLQACGVQRLNDPTRLSAWGQSWLFTHGDALCLSDTDYQRFRREVRSSPWRQQFLALPLAQRQQQARAMRDASATHQANMGRLHWSDIDEPAADRWLAMADAQTLVHGHTHRPATNTLPSGRLREVLTDWDLDGGTPPRAGVLRLSAAGGQRIDLAGR